LPRLVGAERIDLHSGWLGVNSEKCLAKGERGYDQGINERPTIRSDQHSPFVSCFWSRRPWHNCIKWYPEDGRVSEDGTGACQGFLYRPWPEEHRIESRSFGNFKFGSGLLD